MLQLTFARACVFDALQVETIGDCYMAATNLDGESSKTHAQDMVQFAKELVLVRRAWLVRSSPSRRLLRPC